MIRSRTLLRFVLIACGGGVIAYGLAWAIAIVGVDLGYIGTFEPPAVAPRWRYAIAAGPGATVVESTLARESVGPVGPPSVVSSADPAPRWSLPRRYSPASLPSEIRERLTDGEVLDEYAVGWPLPALRGSGTRRHATAPVAAVEGVSLAALGRNRMQDICVLPVTPLWPGFVVNALFYTAGLAAIFASARAAAMLRRRRRSRRGLCPACGYNLTGLAQGSRCPECGAPILKATTPAAPSPSAVASAAPATPPEIRR